MPERPHGRTRAAETEVTVIVVTWQGEHLLEDCLDSLAAQSIACDVIVVDNASTDGTAELLAARRPPVRVLRLDSNTGFAGGVQAGLALVRTPFVALLNNDASASPDWLANALVGLRPDLAVAAVTSKMLLWTDDRSEHDDPTDHTDRAVINNAGVSLTSAGYGVDRGADAPDGPPFDRPAEVFGFSGGAAVLRTDAARAVGGMPSRFFLYYEDVDLSWRLRLAGLRIRYEPAAVVRHRHAATTDRRSEGFAYYNERNRLLTLTRCAPLALATGQVARFVLTTISLQVRRALGQTVPDVPVFRWRVRLRALTGFVRLLPWALSERRAITRWAGADSRRTVARRWLDSARSDS